MKIGFFLFPNITQLDFTGPLQILNRLPDAETYAIAETLAPIATDCGIAIVPTHDYTTAPEVLDMICVPGGFGVIEALSDEGFIEFLRAKAHSATYVTSVCTGAFLLGKAGLLAGKKATTHWAYTDLLEKVGAIFTEGRVVRDGNTFTGGGVTAGIDFALTIAAEVADEAIAQSLQLAVEYNPAPPFQSGHPSVADPRILEGLQTRIYADANATMAQALA